MYVKGLNSTGLGQSVGLCLLWTNGSHCVQLTGECHRGRRSLGSGCGPEGEHSPHRSLVSALGVGGQQTALPPSPPSHATADLISPGELFGFSNTSDWATKHLGRTEVTDVIHPSPSGGPPLLPFLCLDLARRCQSVGGRCSVLGRVTAQLRGIEYGGKPGPEQGEASSTGSDYPL